MTVRSSTSSGSAYIFDLEGPICNENALCAARNIGEGSSLDADGNGVPDERCLGDLDGDGVVGAEDLALLLGGWGACE